MKKKVFALAVVAICVATLASSTLAYFTAEDEAHNVITSGAVDILLQEWQETENGLVPYPNADPIPVMPGTTVSKIATVKNLEAEAYIRAKFEVIVTDAEGKVMELSQETLDSIITIAVNGEDWIRKDGDSQWWYCADAVATGASTEPFFTEVVFAGAEMGNEYQNCTVEIIVQTQAVQAANNGDSAVKALGWPEN